MQIKQKNIIKKIVDICMTVLLLCLMAYQVTGEALHEWIGIGMTVVLIIHHILNIKWYASLFKGKYNAYRIITVIVNTLLLASIALTALCGMAMSSHAVPFLYGFLPITFARRFHLAMSFWSFILMGLHLGLHIPAISAGLIRNGKLRATLAVIGTVAAGCGFWLFIKNGIPDYIFFRTPFAFLDYEKSAVVVFAENFAELIAFVFLGTVCVSLIKSCRNRNNENKNKLFINLIFVLIAALICVTLLLYSANDNKDNDASAWNASLPQTQPFENEPAEIVQPASPVEPQAQTNPVNINDGYILITGGTYLMGSPAAENWRIDDETQH